MTENDFIEILGQHVNFLQKMSEWETDWDENITDKLPALMRPFFKFVDQLMTSAFGFRVGSEKEKLFFFICWQQFYRKAFFVSKTNVVFFFLESNTYIFLEFSQMASCW